MSGGLTWAGAAVSLRPALAGHTAGAQKLPLVVVGGWGVSSEPPDAASLTPLLPRGQQHGHVTEKAQFPEFSISFSLFCSFSPSIFVPAGLWQEQVAKRQAADVSAPFAPAFMHPI